MIDVRNYLVIKKIINLKHIREIFWIKLSHDQDKFRYPKCNNTYSNNSNLKRHIMNSCDHKTNTNDIILDNINDIDHDDKQVENIIDYSEMMLTKIPLKN